MNTTTTIDLLTQAAKICEDQADRTSVMGAVMQLRECAAKIRAIPVNAAREGQQEPVGYRHTLHMELGQTRSVLIEDKGNVFGVRGRDYDPSYSVTVEPVYLAAPVAQQSEALPAGVCWSEQRTDFYHAGTGASMGSAFYAQWRDRADEFPDRDTARKALDAQQSKAGDESPASLCERLRAMRLGPCNDAAKMIERLAAQPVEAGAPTAAAKCLTEDDLCAFQHAIQQLEWIASGTTPSKNCDLYEDRNKATIRHAMQHAHSALDRLKPAYSRLLNSWKDDAPTSGRESAAPLAKQDARIADLRTALQQISETRFGYEGDCGTTRIADDALYADEQAAAMQKGAQHG